MDNPKNTDSKTLTVKAHANKRSQALDSGKHSSIGEWIEKIAHYLLPIAVSAGLVIWLFHKINVHRMMDALHQGCNYWWIILMMLVLTMSRAIRGIRWGYQLRASGVGRLPAIAEIMSIFGAYALNLVFSWLGEAWRCIYVAKRQKAPVSTVVGTDLGDRLSDAIVIVLLVFFSFFVARPALDHFFNHYAVGEDLIHFFTDTWFWCGLAVFAALLLGAWRIFHNCKYVKKLESTVKNLWQGFKVLFTMQHLGIYWTLTLCIWICYFLQTYLCFFAFPFTRHLITDPGSFYGLVPGLVVFIFGSLSIAVPSTGGLGPWNIAVMFALSLYGVDSADAAAYSFVVWGFQTGIQVVLGIICAIYVGLTRKKSAAPSPSHSAAADK